MDTAKTLPLVSVVVPVYNGERYLAESLDSIINQTYPNLEILVMDDASTDRTPGIIETYSDKVACYRNGANLGQFANVNKGIELAKGAFVCVYHADDIYQPEIVAREAQYLMENRTAGAVFCLDRFIDANGKIYNQLQIPTEVRGGGPFDYATILNTLLTYKNVFLVGPTSMVRRSVYFDVGQYRGEEYRIAADLEMWARISKSYDIGIIEEHLHDYRHDHGNLSQNYYHLRTEIEIHFRILQEHLDNGGLALAWPESLRAHRAHWAEDLLMVTVNHYIIGDLATCRELLGQVRPDDLLGSPHIQRYRLLVLYKCLQVLSHMPRMNYAAELFRARWHNNKSKTR